MVRVQGWRWCILGFLLAWPVGKADAQASSRVAISPFAGVEFRGGQNPLFGLGAVIPLPAEVSAIAAASTVRYTGVWQLEAGVRWPALADVPVRPYLGAGLSLLRWPSADLAAGATWRLGGVAIGGIEARALGVTAFVEGVGVTDGTWAFQVRGGLRLQAP